MQKQKFLVLTVLLVLAVLFIPLSGMAEQDSSGSGGTELFTSFVELDHHEHRQSFGTLTGSTSEMAALAVRAAKVELSGKALDAIKFAPGEMISVALFDNHSLDVRVRKVEMIGEATAARGQVEGSDFGFMIATSFEDLALIIVELPDQNRQYKVVYDHALNEHILYEFNLDELDKLPESAPLIPLSEEALAEAAAEAVQSSNPATIDVMIVYTPAASTWATANATSIFNVIALAMAKADEVMDNSYFDYGYQLIEFRLVVSSQVAYTESGNSITDLTRMTDGTHGFNVVHGLRNTYGADLVALFAHVSDTGGLGWILNNTSGLPDYGYSLTRVQQAHNTFTHVHEMGHNMGAHHHKLQSVQPGPGLYSYSAGWRWSYPSGNYYCSVMTYEGGQYFGDGKSATRIAIFSNPRVGYRPGGESEFRATGDASHGDNARGLANVRRVVSNYRAPYDASMILGIPSGTWWFTPGGKWDFVSPSQASTITYADRYNDGINNLFASFGSGTWYIDSHGYWQQLTTSTASALAGRTYGYLAIAIPSGTWIYDTWFDSWLKLSSVPAHALTWADTTGDNFPDTLFASYSSGLWAVKPWGSDPVASASRSSEAVTIEPSAPIWVRVTTSTVGAMSGLSGGWIVASMPSGLWLYDARYDSWVKHYTTSTARDITFTDMTGNGLSDLVVGLHSGTWYVTYYDVWPDPISSERGQVGEVGPASVTWHQLTSSTAGALQKSHDLPY